MKIFHLIVWVVIFSNYLIVHKQLWQAFLKILKGVFLLYKKIPKAKRTTSINTSLLKLGNKQNI